MSTVSEGSTVALDRAQLAWLKKMGEVLKSRSVLDYADDSPPTDAYSETGGQKRPDIYKAKPTVPEPKYAEIPKSKMPPGETEKECGYEGQKEVDSHHGGRGSTGGEGEAVTEQEYGAGAGEGSGNGAPPTQEPYAPAAECAKYQKQVLKCGAAGPAVECLQKMLGGGVTVDGKYGPGTEKAVQTYQKSKGLTADGVVGPATWAALGGAATKPGGYGNPPTKPTAPGYPPAKPGKPAYPPNKPGKPDYSPSPPTPEGYSPSPPNKPGYPPKPGKPGYAPAKPGKPGYPPSKPDEPDYSPSPPAAAGYYSPPPGEPGYPSAKPGNPGYYPPGPGEPDYGESNPYTPDHPTAPVDSYTPPRVLEQEQPKETEQPLPTVIDQAKQGYREAELEVKDFGKSLFD